MAQVRDIKLMTGTTPDHQVVAEVQFAVEFSQAELNQNMQFGLYVMLVAVDERMQPVSMMPNGAREMQFQQPERWMNSSHPRQQDQVLSIAREFISPRNCKTQFYTRRAVLQRNSRFMNWPGFFAQVAVIPEITEGRGWSRVVQLQPNQQLFMPFDQETLFMNNGMGNNSSSQAEQVYAPGVMNND
jgi:hypothetical protein